MLAEIEQGLVAHIQASPLAARLRQVDALPDLDGDSLVARFGADAPAVYVALGGGPLQDGMLSLTVGIACVARNSRSPQAARQGDGMQIGLLELVHEVITLIHAAYIDGFSYLVLRWDPVASDALTRKGLYAAVVQAQTEGYYGS
jgi:hypothetical protein